MGYIHSSYAFYGVHVPSSQYKGYAPEEGERLDGVIKSVSTVGGPRVGHVSAGPYDDDMLFLCVVPDGWDVEVELGAFRSFRCEKHQEDLPGWDRALSRVAAAAGYRNLEEPGWIVVPSLD